MKIFIALVLISTGLLFLRYELVKPRKIVIVVCMADSMDFVLGKGN